MLEVMAEEIAAKTADATKAETTIEVAADGVMATTEVRESALNITSLFLMRLLTKDLVSVSFTTIAAAETMTKTVIESTVSESITSTIAVITKTNMTVVTESISVMCESAGTMVETITTVTEVMTVSAVAMIK